MADWNTVIIERPFPRFRSSLPWGLALVLTVAVAACGTHTRGSVPPGTNEPDKFLFDKGTDALNAKKWLTAREFFKQVTETYTQSPYRPDAKLGIGDTYLGEGTAEALVLAINEFREFLSFYPTNRRADYAQYKLGMSHFRQMRAAQRDQTETREALKEFETFVTRYPQSSLMPEVKAKLRETRDRLSESDYLVGYFYFRQRWYPGAIERFKALLKEDPEYTARDAVFYHLAESLARTRGREAEALPYFEQLVKEFEQSEYLPLAQKRITELKTQAVTKTSGK
jgi:outer membrane protein assembly factor BamD